MSKSDFSQNWGIIGHSNVVDFLKKTIAVGNISHAYLFSGPAGIGKKKITRALIKALFCAKPSSGNPCDQCSECLQLEKNIHPDVFLVDRLVDPKTENLKKNISIEQVRELKNKLSLGSFLNSYKIAVVNQAELMSTEAANALLKILEEPEQKVVLILIARDTDVIPKTILSRCQNFNLELVDRNLIHESLIKMGSTRNLADNLSYLAAGRPGLAVKFFRDNEPFSLRQEKVKEFLRLTSGTLAEKFQIVEVLSKEGEGLINKIKNIEESLDVWQSVIRDVILIKNCRQDTPDGIINYWLQEELKKANIYKKDTVELRGWIAAIDQTKALFGSNVNPQLALEHLVLQF
ncbi:MAG: DNA polymerase III subunit [Patescibacteria group bacterium]|jgi:DNA polymerase-3 subunit delta'